MKSKVKTTKNPSFHLWSLRRPAKWISWADEEKGEKLRFVSSKDFFYLCPTLVEPKSPRKMTQVVFPRLAHSSLSTTKSPPPGHDMIL